MKVTDDHSAKVKISSVWEKNYVVDGWQTRFLTPSYNLPRYSLEANRHHFTNIPNDKLQYLINSYNLDNCYQIRAARGLESVIVNQNESLAEGIDYHVSQGMYSFELNAIGSTNRKWNENVPNALSFVGDIVRQEDPLNPVILQNIDFENFVTSNEWTIELVNLSEVENITTSSNNWVISHNLQSEDVVWQIYLETGTLNEFEAILATNVSIPNDHEIDIDFSSPYTGKVAVFEAKPSQIFEVLTPSNIWTINHNFGTKNIYVQPLIFNGSTFDYIVPLETIVLNDNSVEVHFSNAQSGKVFIIELSNRFEVPVASTTWTVPGDFSNNKTPIFQVFIDNGSGTFIQEFPVSPLISPTEMQITFSVPKSGYLSYAQVDSLWFYEVSSTQLGFIKNAVVSGPVVWATTTTLDQQIYYVDHNPYTVVVSLNGNPLVRDVDYHSEDTSTIVIHQMIDANQLIQITSVSNRVITPDGTSFDIIGAGTVGAKAFITLPTKGIGIASDAPQEKWTLIKVNPISFERVHGFYSGLSQVEAVAYTWPTVSAQIVNSEFAYLRQWWRVYVHNIVGNTAILRAQNLSTGQHTNVSTGIEWEGSITNTVGTIGTFDALSASDSYLRFNITVGARKLHVGDEFVFTFGYDRDLYEQFHYDNSWSPELSTRGVVGDLQLAHHPIKLLPLGSAYPHAVSETITLTFVQDPDYPLLTGGAFKVTGSVSGEHPYAFLGKEYDNGLFRFRLVRSSELFDKYAMFADPNGYSMAYAQRAIDAYDLVDGDELVFIINDRRPNYLVHGSQTGYTKPASVGYFYWNGKIGFQLDAPVFSVSQQPSHHDTILSSGTFVIDNSTSITFHNPPRFDASNERLKFVYHTDASTSMKVRDNDEQFLLYSSTRGQLPAVQINERYTEWECAERMSERTFNLDLTINDSIFNELVNVVFEESLWIRDPNDLSFETLALFKDNKKPNLFLSNSKPIDTFYVDIIANQFKMVHSQDVLILNEPYSSITRLDVNSYQEDVLTLELGSNHPELGSTTTLVPTFLVAVDYKSSGYDGSLLAMNQSSTTDPNVVIEDNVAYMGGVVDASFTLDPYSASWDGYDPGFTLLNAPKLQNPVIPDRGFKFEVWLSNVGYQDEIKHNKVGTLTWQFDPDAGFSRQVLDFTDNFASHYLKLNTSMSLIVAQADEYNDLMRVMISERLSMIFAEQSIHIDLPSSDVPGDNNAETSFDDFDIEFKSSYLMPAYHGYDMYGFDMEDFAIDLPSGTSYAVGGYEEDLPDPSNITVLDIQTQIGSPITKIYENPVSELLVRLADMSSTINLYTHTPSLPSAPNQLGYPLVEGLDYTMSEISVNGIPTYKLIKMELPGFPDPDEPLQWKKHPQAIQMVVS